MRSVVRESHDTVTLRIDTTKAPALLAYRPGQFNMLYAFGVGDVPISIAGTTPRGLLLHTIRDAGTTTRILAGLRRGGTVGVRGPYGSAWPLEEAAGGDVLLVAGGLGLAPLRPALLHLLRHRRQYRRLILLYGSRTPADLLYRRELASWAEEAEVLVTVDWAGIDWDGHVGVVPALLDRLVLDPPRTTVLLCGPEPMMRFTVRDLRLRGIPDEAIHVSMERNMVCGIGFCGHCQLGPAFVCKDGPVLRLDRIAFLFEKREI